MPSFREFYTAEGRGLLRLGIRGNYGPGRSRRRTAMPTAASAIPISTVSRTSVPVSGSVGWLDVAAVVPDEAVVVGVAVLPDPEPV
jgi:hypothetical protein